MSFEDGTTAFNERRFFDAHEHWEDVWRDARDPERRWIQGLIQIAAGFHKVTQGSAKNGAALLYRGIGKIVDAPATFRRIDLRTLREAAERAARALEIGGAGQFREEFPTIRYTEPAP